MMGKWKEEMEVEFVKLANRVESLEQQVVALSRDKADVLKSYKQIQEDWYARHGDMVRSPPDIKHFENKAAQNLPFVRIDRPC